MTFKRFRFIQCRLSPLMMLLLLLSCFCHRSCDHLLCVRLSSSSICLQRKNFQWKFYWCFCSSSPKREFDQTEERIAKCTIVHPLLLVDWVLFVFVGCALGTHLDQIIPHRVICIFLDSRFVPKNIPKMKAMSRQKQRRHGGCEMNRRCTVRGTNVYSFFSLNSKFSR